MTLSRFRAVCAALGAAIATVTACSGSSDSGDDDTMARVATDPSTSASPAATDPSTSMQDEESATAEDLRPPDGFFVKQLNYVPQQVTTKDWEDVQVVIADLTTAAATVGAVRPDQPVADEVMQYAAAITDVRLNDSQRAFAALPAIVRPASIPRVEEFHDELGWSIVDVATFIEYRSPQTPYTVLGGGFSEQAMNDAMGQRQDGAWRVGPDNEDSPDIRHATVARPAGESLRIGLRDGHLIVANRAEMVTIGLTDGAQTLVDDPAMRELAASMDEAGAYAACLLAHRSFSVEDSVPRLPAPEVPLEELMLPAPFTAMGGGVADRNGELVTILTYVHDSTDTAKTNADALTTVFDGAWWSQEVELDQVNVDGVVVTATMIGLPTTVADCGFDRQLFARHA